MRKLHILYVGSLWRGGTCLQRMEALTALGHYVQAIDTEPGGLSEERLLSRHLPRRIWRKVHTIAGMQARACDGARANQIIKAKLSEVVWDVLWIDKGLVIEPRTLQMARVTQPNCKIVGYSPDDMASIQNQSRQFLGHLTHYDFFFTTKSYGVKDLKELGCPKPIFIGNAYCPSLHRPISITEDERSRYGGQVGFIGAYEKDRAYHLYKLAASGVPIRIWGTGWKRCRYRHVNMKIEKAALWSEDYVKAICSFDINLCFLRKANRDLQTTRSIEIPACGAFMLAERTNEHLDLFREGEEAEFFIGLEELIAKAKFYLVDEEKRKRIAQAGRSRCINSGYSNVDRMNAMLETIFGKIAAI